MSDSFDGAFVAALYTTLKVDIWTVCAPEHLMDTWSSLIFSLRLAYLVCFVSLQICPWNNLPCVSNGKDR